MLSLVESFAEIMYDKKMNQTSGKVCKQLGMSWRYQLLFGFFMALLMGMLISLVLVAVNSGTGAGFLRRWFEAFYIGFIVAYPSALICAPLCQKLTSAIIEKLDESFKVNSK